MYDDAYFQRSRANFWDIANPTYFDTYLHFSDCLCDQVSECPIINRKHFLFSASPRWPCFSRLIWRVKFWPKRVFVSFAPVHAKCKGNYNRSWCNRSIFLRNYHYIHFKILQDFLFSSFNIPKYISRLSLPSLCEPRYNREDGLLVFGLKPYTFLMVIVLISAYYHVPKSIHFVAGYGCSYYWWPPATWSFGLSENWCLLYAPRRFRRNRQFFHSFIYLFRLIYWRFFFLFVCNLCNHNYVALL